MIQRRAQTPYGRSIENKVEAPSIQRGVGSSWTSGGTATDHAGPTKPPDDVTECMVAKFGDSGVQIAGMVETVLAGACGTVAAVGTAAGVVTAGGSLALALAACAAAALGIPIGIVLYMLTECIGEESLVTLVKSRRAPSQQPGPTPEPTAGARACLPQGNRGPFPHPTLKKGAIGPAVGELQEKLNIAGASSLLEVDCQFGAVTERAVADFQLNQGLDADGIVGPKTWEALDLVAPTPGLVQLPPVVITGDLNNPGPELPGLGPSPF